MTDHFTLNSRAWVHVIVDVKLVCLYVLENESSVAVRSTFWTKLSKADLHLGLAT